MSLINHFHGHFSGGKKGGTSAVFEVIPPVVNFDPTLQKISSTLFATSTGVYTSIRMNLTAKRDILVSSVSAVIGLRDVNSGAEVATQSVTGITDSGLTIYTEGATKPVNFYSILPKSGFAVGTTTVKSFVKSFSYTLVSATSSQTIKENLGQFDSDSSATVIVSTSQPFQFTRNLVVGSSGTDVIELKKFLNAKGYNTGTLNDYFGASTQSALAQFQASVGISPAEGSMGAITRQVINNMLIQAFKG